MTPSNPDNQQPLIYRIADALGVFHLVAPVNHTHSPAEVEGLIDELNELWASLDEKANAEDVTEALAGKANAIGAGSPTGAIVIANTSGEISRSNKTITELLNAIAGKANAIGAGSPTGAIVIANTSGEISRSNKTITELLNAIAAKAAVDHTHSQYATTADVNAALAGKMANTALSIGLEYDSETGNLSHSSDTILSNIAEGIIAPAMVEIYSTPSHSPIGKTLAAVKWNYSATNVFKVITIYLNDATYEIRFKNEDSTWGVLTKAASSISSLLPA